MDNKRRFLGLIILTGLINDYYLFRTVYFGRGEKRYPVI